MPCRPWPVLAVAFGWPLLGADAVPSVHVARYGVGLGPLGGAQAIRVEGAPLVHTAQFLSVDTAGELAGSDDPGTQVRQALDNLAQALDSAGSSLDHLVRLNAVTADEKATSILAHEIETRFRLDSRPAVTLVEANLPVPGALIALDAVAAIKISANVQQEPAWTVSPKLPRVPGGSNAAVLPTRSLHLYFGQGRRWRTGSSRQRRSGAKLTRH